MKVFLIAVLMMQAMSVLAQTEVPDTGATNSHGDRHLGHGTWGMRDKFKFYQ